MGVAIGDYDHDGYQDIFISGVGNFVLYHNNGNGTFTDVTASSGIQATQWGSSPLWFDYDNDGKLDLFVGEFADYSNNRLCRQAESYGGMGKDGAPARLWLSLLQSTKYWRQCPVIFIETSVTGSSRT